MTERKHLYLITEHEREEFVGTVQLQDQKRAWPDKNKEGNMTEFRPEKNMNETVGKMVCLGYHDFDQGVLDDDPDRVSEILQNKVREIDDKWLDKAGVDLDD